MYITNPQLLQHYLIKHLSSGNYCVTYFLTLVDLVGFMFADLRKSFQALRLEAKKRENQEQRLECGVGQVQVAQPL